MVIVMATDRNNHTWQNIVDWIVKMKNYLQQHHPVEMNGARRRSEQSTLHSHRRGLIKNADKRPTLRYRFESCSAMVLSMFLFPFATDWLFVFPSDHPPVRSSPPWRSPFTSHLVDRIQFWHSSQVTHFNSRKQEHRQMVSQLQLSIINTFLDTTKQYY